MGKYRLLLHNYDRLHFVRSSDDKAALLEERDFENLHTWYFATEVYMVVMDESNNIVTD